MSSSGRFSEKDVVDILRRAAELQTPDEKNESSFSYDQLVSMAEETGLPRDALERALAERQAPRPSMWDRVVGGPLVTHIEETFEGEIPDRVWADFVQELKTQFKRPGTASTLAHVHEWKSGDRELDPIVVTATKRGGKTRLVLDSDMSGILIPFGLLAFMIVLVTSLGIFEAKEVVMWVRALIVIGFLPLAWMGFRAIFGAGFRGRRREIMEMRTRFADLMRESQTPTVFPLEEPQSETSQIQTRLT